MKFSKSLFVRGYQCPKSLWLDRNKCDVFVEPKGRTESGHEVGRLAREYFGDFYLVEFDRNYQKMAKDTQAAIEAGYSTICEATFITENALCMVDILHRDEKGWSLIEVKATTKVKEHHLVDVAFQHDVVTNAGYKISADYVMHLNNSYVRYGQLDLSRLFVLKDVTQEVKKSLSEIEDKLQIMDSTASQEDEPKIEIGPQCTKPYECGYKRYCWRHVPENSVFSIAGMRTTTAFSFVDKGVITYQDLLNNPQALKRLSKKQQEQVLWAGKESSPLVNKEKIKEFLNSVRYPLGFLDFETVQSAIPLFDGAKPFMQIPFQYSFHLDTGSELVHTEYLANSINDSRKILAMRLIEAAKECKCILAYNMSFEKRVIVDLANAYPDLRNELMAIHDRIIDLMDPFRKHYYYSAAQGGSYSIKYVLPAMFPNEESLDYGNLEGVHNGSEAMEAFMSLPSLGDYERSQIRNQLLSYCELDTFALVKILDELKMLVSHD